MPIIFAFILFPIHGGQKGCWTELMEYFSMNWKLRQSNLNDHLKTKRKALACQERSVTSALSSVYQQLIPLRPNSLHQKPFKMINNPRKFDTFLSLTLRLSFCFPIWHHVKSEAHESVKLSWKQEPKPFSTVICPLQLTKSDNLRLGGKCAVPVLLWRSSCCVTLLTWAAQGDHGLHAKNGHLSCSEQIFHLPSVVSKYVVKSVYRFYTFCLLRYFKNSHVTSEKAFIAKQHL